MRRKAQKDPLANAMAFILHMDTLVFSAVRLVFPRRNFLSFLVLTLSFCSHIKSERVYDCSTQTTAVATYSLDEVGECPPFEKTYKNKTHVRAQILQRSGNQMLEGFQCQLVIRREACYCSPLGNRKSSFSLQKRTFKQKRTKYFIL